MLRVFASRSWSLARAAAPPRARWAHALAAKPHDTFLELQWSDNTCSRFHYVWLRDHCPQCVHKSTLQRDFDTHLIPLAIRPQHVALEDGKLTLAWPENHESRFDVSWLQKHSYDPAPKPRLYHPSVCDSPHLWGREMQERAFGLAVPCDEFMNTRAGLLAMLESLAKYGFAVVVDTPRTKEEVRALLERVGPVLNTFYGSVWDTAPVDNPNDTALTKVELPVHTDCTYMHHPPGLQFFNCAAQSNVGPEAGEGSTVLVDGFRVAQILKEQHPDAFRFFTTVPIHSQSIESQVHVQARGRVFDVDEEGRMVRLRFNDLDRSPLTHLDFAQVAEFYKHRHTLVSIMRAEEQQMLLKLQPGQMVVVNNERVMHGRKSFTGFRSLVGGYMASDDWQSKLRVLREEKARGEF